MLEEVRLIQRVRDGRGKLAPMVPGRLRFSREFLSKEQREAVRHVLQSNDQVIAIRGVAGAGKTTAMQEVREQLQNAGVKIFAFAQSADASHGVLREAGFHGADTIARLLVDKELQLKTRGSVIFIDESGLVGIRDLAKIMEIAGSSSRVVLVGDTAQHAPVARGDGMRLIENYSGIPVAAIRQIRRQEQLGYREAIKALSGGDTGTGFGILESIGAVVEVQNDAVRYRQLAEVRVAGCSLAVTRSNFPGLRGWRSVSLPARGSGGVLVFS
jgi:ATP-dependent exoDNAse (exonuclease V) alpha subunit